MATVHPGALRGASHRRHCVSAVMLPACGTRQAHGDKLASAAAPVFEPEMLALV